MQIKKTDTATFDAIVIGSGAAGSMAAFALTRAGLDTLVLEAGPLLNAESDFPEPRPTQVAGSILERVRGGISGQHVQVRTTGYRSYLRHFYVNDRANPYSTPHGKPYYWIRGRQVGGRLHTWARMSLRWSDDEFLAASKDGFGEDWPLQYADVEPYYDLVEGLLGLNGREDGVDNLPDGRYRQRHELRSGEIAFKSTIERRWTDRIVIPARIIHAHIDPMPLPLHKAAQTGLLTLKPNCVVSKITTDPHNGKATGVEFVERKTRRQQSVRGRTVFLCASAFETVRLLLNSGCERHPDGIGGSSGVLGRYIMEHLMYITRGTLPEHAGGHAHEPADPYDFAAAQGFYMPKFRNANGQSSDFMRGYGVWGCIGRGGPWWWMGVLGEMLARMENRLTLHPDKRDAWGIPVAHIDFCHGDNDLALLTDAKRTVAGMLEVANLVPHCGRSSWGPAEIFSSRSISQKGTLRPGLSIHEMGGARMGKDPANSVVDANGRCWEAPNVVVADAACFPSGGYQHPALTIMSLAARAADRAVADFDDMAC